MPPASSESDDDVEQLRAPGFLPVARKYDTQENAADDQQR